MSSRNFRHFDPGVNLVPQTSSNVAVAGDIDFSSDTNKFNGHNGTIASPFVLEATTSTLSNKTIAAGSNTITGLTNANLSGSAGITGANIASATIAGSNIITNTIANSNLAQMATHTIKGNATGGTANASDLTGTQVTALLDNFVGDSGSGGTKGLVPAPAAGDAASAKFLKADGTWQPSTGQGVTSVGSIDSQTASVNGAVIVSTTSLVMQSASSTRPGLVNNTTQTMSGAKTFSTSVTSPTINTATINDSGTGLTINQSPGQRLKINSDEGVDFQQQPASPSIPAAGYNSFYFKTDDQPYFETHAGQITCMNGTIGDIMYSVLTEVQFQALRGNAWILFDDRDISSSALGQLLGISNLYDARGLFLRGKNNGRADGKQNPDGNLAIGTYTADTVGPHTHPASVTIYTDNATQGALARGTNGGGGVQGAESVTVSANSGTQTAPANLTVNIFIKIN